ncbi:MAG: hypothetical protein AAFV95_06990 [Bacteroidota bacterium]
MANYATEEMNDSKPKTRQEFADELNISRTTLYRWLKKNKIDLPSGLIYPEDQNAIMKKLGYKSDDGNFLPKASRGGSR